MGSIRTCFTTPVVSEIPNSVVTSVVNNDGSAVETGSIRGLDIGSSKSVHFIPRGFKEFFPNLIALSASHCRLKSLTYHDLRQFGSTLEYLMIYKNEIVSIERFLLSKNPNLKFFRLDGNNLKYIEPEFFNELKNHRHLQYVDFRSHESGSCMNQAFVKKRDGSLADFNWNYNDCYSTEARHLSYTEPIKEIISNV